MILPQGTSLYRYCVGIDIPETWDPTFENPEYANRPQGKKNQIGAYFFYEFEKMAKNVAGVALKNYGHAHQVVNYTLTTCQTTRDLTLLDLRGDLKPFPFLEELYKNGLDILTDDFINYFQGNQLFSKYRDNFLKLIAEKEPFSQTNPFRHQNCELYLPLLMFFSSANNMHILGQLVTDYENGHTFKNLLEQKGYEGYIFNEERDCATICIFDASNLTPPTHTIIEENNYELSKSKL